MKKDIHPKYFPKAKIICSSCGTTYITGSTVEELHVEICSNCHPFYTGKQSVFDTRGRVDRFKRILEKQSAAAAKKVRAVSKSSREKAES